MNCFLRYIAAFFFLSVVLQVPFVSWAAHPLVTDDTGTQGKGKFQLEVNGQYDYDKERVDGVTVKTTGGQAGTTLSYGISESADFVFSVPYIWNTAQEDSMTISDVHGISDMTFEIKWRFYENDGLSFALKPGMIIPTGDDSKGLGAGKVGGNIFFIVTKELAPWAFHVTAGYMLNANTSEERDDIWRISAAATYEVIKNLKLVTDLGMERSRVKGSERNRAFILGGAIYSPVEYFDIDFGVKKALSEAETDLSFLAGVTVRF
ncbi:MAG: transporter [Nitrospirota bacterium]